jgi:mycofactocin precursor
MLETVPGMTALPAETEVDVVVVDDADALVEADLLVEDVSIDGMCGVY